MANTDSTRLTHPSSEASEMPPKPDDTIEAHYASLERLEERYRHQLMDHEERQELRERVFRLRRKLAR